MEEDFLNDIKEQVDYFGEDSLTENQQALYHEKITYQEYLELEKDLYC